jgi:hypothetical protein
VDRHLVRYVILIIWTMFHSKRHVEECMCQKNEDITKTVEKKHNKELGLYCS